EPDGEDSSCQGSLILEHDDLPVIAAPIKKRSEDMARLRAPHAMPANRETPDLATTTLISADPSADLVRVRLGLVDPQAAGGRALTAIENVNRQGYLTHDRAENATLLAQANYGQFGKQSQIAHHILRTGSDEYREEFERYIRDPQENANRAALSLTLANGGY